MKYLLPLLLLTACSATKPLELDPIKTNAVVINHDMSIRRIANCLAMSTEFKYVKGCLLNEVKRTKPEVMK